MERRELEDFFPNLAIPPQKNIPLKVGCHNTQLDCLGLQNSDGYWFFVDLTDRGGLSRMVSDGCLVARAGVQPATFALGVRRSMQLSYRAL